MILIRTNCNDIAIADELNDHNNNYDNSNDENDGDDDHDINTTCNVHAYNKHYVHIMMTVTLVNHDKAIIITMMLVGCDSTSNI